MIYKTIATTIGPIEELLSFIFINIARKSTKGNEESKKLNKI